MATVTILEGPDGAGKTTFAKCLGVRYHHEGVPPKGVDLFAHYAGVLHGIGDDTVIDRFALGELIYGPLLRGESRITERDYNMLVRGAGTHHRILTVMCLPPYTVCFENWSRRARSGGELIEKRDLFDRTYELYVKWSDKMDIVFDYTRG